VRKGKNTLKVKEDCSAHYEDSSAHYVVHEKTKMESCFFMLRKALSLRTNFYKLIFIDQY
jgi:hypothetical protein